jgi:hypothetical protein
MTSDIKAVPINGIDVDALHEFAGQSQTSPQLAW